MVGVEGSNPFARSKIFINGLALRALAVLWA
jgi:hypothetical protein